MREIRVGLISDTHGLFRPRVKERFAGVAFIVHAGDVGRAALLDDLRAIAPVEAVFGNVDDPHNPALAAHRTLAVGDLTLHVSHGHELGRPTPAALAARYDADILVFGHTHRAVVTRVSRGSSAVLVVNPGAAGPRRFDLTPSVALLTVTGRDARAEILDLD